MRVRRRDSLSQPLIGTRIWATLPATSSSLSVHTPFPSYRKEMVLFATRALLTAVAARIPVPYCNTTSDVIWRHFSCNYDWHKEWGVARNCPETKRGEHDDVWGYKCPLANEEDQRCNVAFFVEAGVRQLYCDRVLQESELEGCPLIGHFMKGEVFVYSCSWRPYWQS